MSFLSSGILSLSQWPMDIPTTPASLLWALPICLSIALVYKAIKLENLTARGFVREVSLLFVTIIVFLVIAAAALIAISKIPQYIYGQ